MEGKELWRLLDFVGGLRKEGNAFEEGAEQADDESRIANLKETAKADLQFGV
jgi:hypothetical protein